MGQEECNFELFLPGECRKWIFIKKSGVALMFYINREKNLQNK